MKKISFFLTLIMITALLPACAGDYEFELTYESDRTLYLVGETVKITAKVTNVSGRTYTYKGGSSDYRPYVRLYPVLDDDKLGEPLEHLPIASTTDMPSKHKIADGKSGQVTFEFPLPEDAESAALFFIQRLAVLGFAKFEIDKGELDTAHPLPPEHGIEDKSSKNAKILE